MGKKIKPNGSFIQNWLETREKEGKLDKRILALIRENLTGANLQELKEVDIIRDLIDLGGAKKGGIKQ